MSGWKWTCEECGDTGPMPYSIFDRLHNCKSNGPSDTVARLLIEPAPEPSDPSTKES